MSRPVFLFVTEKVKNKQTVKSCHQFSRIINSVVCEVIARERLFSFTIYLMSGVCLSDELKQ